MVPFSVTNKSKSTPKVDDPKKHGRSRIGNGHALLPTIDGRCTWARLVRDVFHSMLSHAGGEEFVPETKRITARRIAVLEAELLYLEDKFANLRIEGNQPDPASLELYQRLSSCQRRHLEALGWERVAKDVTPHPLVYAREYDRLHADDVEEAEA